MTTQIDGNSTDIDRTNINDTDSPYQTQGEDRIHVDTTNGAVTVEIASSDIAQNRRLVIQDIGGNASNNQISVTTEGSETIDPGSESSKSISVNNAALELEANSAGDGLVAVNRNVEREEVSTEEVISGIVKSEGGTIILSHPPVDANLAHWYDASKLTGFADGDSVGTWPDEEATDDLTQGTGSAQPTYQKDIIGTNPVVRGDGTDDFMDVDYTDISEPYEILGIIQQRVKNDAYIFDGLTDSEHQFYQNNSSEWEIFQGTTTVSGGTTDTNVHVIDTIYRSGSNNDVIRIDGTQIAAGDSGNSSSTGLTVFANGADSTFGSVDIAELLVYEAELSTTERANVETYLSDKWGIVI